MRIVTTALSKGTSAIVQDFLFCFSGKRRNVQVTRLFGTTQPHSWRELIGGAESLDGRQADKL